uniref:Uncharacterized protein n=1 Tax=Romanomermis culicivorax TaxID=13658 RepID=A0A915KNG4_ROMCU
MVTKYLTKPRNSCWPMPVFFWNIDPAALNAYHIYQIHNFENIGENIQGTSQKAQIFMCAIQFVDAPATKSQKPVQSLDTQINTTLAMANFRKTEMHNSNHKILRQQQPLPNI